MKETTKKQKMIIAIIILIIIAGIIITATMGLNFDLRFQESKKVELYLGKDFEIKDIKQITNEVMPNQYVIVQKVEVYEDSVSIIAKDINDEQKQNLVNKVNEKYGWEAVKHEYIEGATVIHSTYLKDTEIKAFNQEEIIIETDKEITIERKNIAQIKTIYEW